jgi:transposase-like protein
MRGRPKGSSGIKLRKWTIEEKLEIIKKHVDEHISYSSLSDTYEVNRGLIHAWVKSYLENGEKGLKPKENKRNLMANLYNKKSLTDLEALELENFKLKLEVERLKKGYTVKGVGSNKEYVPTSKMNIKSFKN